MKSELAGFAPDVKNAVPFSGLGCNRVLQQKKVDDFDQIGARNGAHGRYQTGLPNPNFHSIPPKPPA